MPNWCYNNMTITGNPKDLRKFVSDITVSVTDEITKDDGTVEQRTRTRLSISSLYPCPKELTEYHAPLTGRKNDDESSVRLEGDELEALANHLRAMYGATDWYEWCLSHWGTKWGDSDTRLSNDDEYSAESISDTDTSLGMYYETAWSPASGLIAHVSKLYPNLIFQVVSTEEAEMFACWQVFHNGELLGDGIGETEVPDEISSLYDDGDDSKIDEYYERMNEWQCERNDKLDSESDKCVSDYLDGVKERRDRVEYAYKVRMVNLTEERDKALAEFDASEVILNKGN